MKVINSVTTVQLAGIDQEILYNAYAILNELYRIIDENDCERATNIPTNESYDRVDVALTANVLQMLAPTEKVEIGN